MTGNTIKEVAIIHFAKKGYGEASLSEIAADVGIKKPSIYSHFKGKEALYFSCVEDTFTKDVLFLQYYMKEQANKRIEDTLYHLFVSYEKRIEESMEVKFWIRSLYFPPEEFKEALTEKGSEHIKCMSEQLFPIVKKAMEKGVIRNLPVDDVVDAYLCIFDGLIIELIYGGKEKFYRRLEATWPIFWRGICK